MTIALQNMHIDAALDTRALSVVSREELPSLPELDHDWCCGMDPSIIVTIARRIVLVPSIIGQAIA